MNKRLSLITAPASEPITLSEAKSHLRIDDTREDTYVTTLIGTARHIAETYTRRAFITQTWAMFLKDSPAESSIELPRAPLLSVDHVKAHNDDGTETLLSTSNYHVTAYAGTTPDNGLVTLKNGNSWPEGDRTRDKIEIQYIAGYGDASSVPTSIKNAILMLIGHLYENRGDCDTASMPVTIKHILMPFRMIRL